MRGRVGLKKGAGEGERGGGGRCLVKEGTEGLGQRKGGLVKEGRLKVVVKGCWFERVVGLKRKNLEPSIRPDLQDWTNRESTVATNIKSKPKCTSSHRPLQQTFSSQPE